jgi:hypothetical protein
MDLRVPQRGMCRSENRASQWLKRLLLLLLETQIVRTHTHTQAHTCSAQMLQPNDGLSLRTGQDDDYRRDTIERDEKRLAELGRKTVEMFVISQVFTERLEVGAFVCVCVCVYACVCVCARACRRAYVYICACLFSRSSQE